MANEAVIPFKGTVEQEAELKELIAEYKGQAGALIPVLHGAQEIYGYLPIEVQTMIADAYDKIYGKVGVLTITPFSMEESATEKEVN